MKKYFTLILLLAAALLLMGSTAAEKAPKPQAHLIKHDGYSVIRFDIPEDTNITYTVDGSLPTSRSPKYTGDDIRFDENGKVKLRVSKSGRKTTVYTYNIKVTKKAVIKPRPLKKGDTIGVVAPAKYLTEGDIDIALELIRSYGYKVKVGATCSLKDGVYAGTPAQRAADINKFFADDSVAAIVCLRGGSGSMDILDKLDYASIAAHPKLFIGFSDITAIHSAVYRKCGLVTVHGSMISNFVSPHTGYTVSQFFGGLAESGAIGKVKLPEGTALRSLCDGTAEGRIVGGNLSRMIDLIGTPYAIDATDSILLIEDTHESADSIEQKLRILEKKGIIRNCAGIAFGEFTDSDDCDGMSWKDVITDFAERNGKPCIMGLPAGHDEDNMFLPLGVKARLSANANGESSLEILESVYQ